MTDTAARVVARLRALFDAVATEAHANPSFARKVETSLAAALEPRLCEIPNTAAARPLHAAKKEVGETHPMLHNITFDPLECQLEAALLNGLEQEARAFLGKLNRGQLEAVVKAQRLPGAKGLQKKIEEDDQASAVEAIVGSAAERVRSRFSAAG
jgi:hypothetical protein